MLDHRSFTQYLSRTDIDALIQDIAGRINKDYEGKTVVLVGVLKGSFLFVADLIRHLTVDARVDFVKMSSLGKTKESPGTVVFQKDVSTDFRGKHVLIVEQIIDSGRALKFLYERLKATQAESVEVVTLLDKTDKRMVDTPVKYVGRKTKDQFLVGYGLDLEENSRNLGEIYYLKYPN